MRFPDPPAVTQRLLEHFHNQQTGEDVHLRAAALLFNVAPEDVTPEMRARAKTRNYAVLYSPTNYPRGYHMKTILNFDPHESAMNLYNVQSHQVTPSMLSTLHTTGHPINPRPASDPVWPDCPDCQQAATGTYRGIPGCSRCGWSAGGTKSARRGFL